MSTSDKLLSVLSLFSMEESEWTVEGAAKRLGLATSTAYRYFHSLSNAGLIVAFAAGRYVLGPAIVQLDRQMRLLDPLLRIATPIMQQLVRDSKTPGVFLLCRLYRSQVMCVHQEYAGKLDYAVSYERGRLMALHRGAASKVILANLPARSVRVFHQNNKDDMKAVGLGRDWQSVKTSLRRIRSSPTCVTHAELDPNVTGIASPVFDPEGEIIGSLGLVLADKHSSASKIEASTEMISKAAAKITSQLAALAIKTSTPTSTSIPCKTKGVKRPRRPL